LIEKKGFFERFVLLKRAATQTYIENEKRHREILLNQNANKRKHPPTRQSTQTQPEYTQQMPNPLSSFNGSDDDDRLFRVSILFRQKKQRKTKKNRSIKHCHHLRQLSNPVIQILADNKHDDTLD